ncbi:nucleoside hydrolase [Bacteroides sp. GD17]|jgi:inosine-uridine nucleoside N-ribohydrolase|uniref:nucleoside hydrolase n=1 Tax=Bacteroides sp. GD17 TaxID=3139826 RepID=UPI0025F8119B|nr:nucleoside hydrolase [uncultured Bacteroides sp.]
MRKNRLYFTGLLILTLSSCTSTPKQQNTEVTSNAERIILETDIGNDVDDALALDMLYKYIDAGNIDLLGIMINKEGQYPAEYVDIMNTWYGYQIPIGIIHNGPDCENDATNYAKAVCLLKNENNEPAFKRSLKGGYDQLPEAPALYRKILSQQPDSSVTVISIGFSTNLARLLDTPADDISPLTGKELVAKKVKLLCTMGGCFNSPDFFEYNIVKDIPAAKKVFTEWPSQVVTSPFEVGIAINYPVASIENDFQWAPIHPVVEAYKSYNEMPYDTPTWDLTSALYSVEGPSYFNVSPAGKINVTDKGATEFTPDTTGNRYYLTVDSVQAETIKQHFVKLISQQPVHFNKK